jgi:hypothetical protein
VKYPILALLVVTFSLPVMAGKPTKEQITSDPEQALSGTDTCKFTIGEEGVKRQASTPEQQKCEAKILKDGKGKTPAY